MSENARASSATHSIEAAALAGLAHVLLFLLARGILLRLPDPDDASLTAWYANSDNQRSLVMALNLITIGSIAFLWFVPSSDDVWD